MTTVHHTYELEWPPNDPKRYVEMMREMNRRLAADGKTILGDPTPVYEFLLQHGHEFQGQVKPSRYAWRTSRMCFWNSWQLAVRTGLTYCEGYAMSDFFPLHHAWCVDENSNVIDTTWRMEGRDPSKWEYFGVPFRVAPLHAWMKKKPTASVLFDLQYDQEDFGVGLGVDDFIFRLDTRKSVR